MRRGRILRASFSLFPNLKLLVKWCKLFTKMKLFAKIAVISAVVMAFIVIFGWAIFPKLLKNQIKAQVALSAKSEIRKMYLKVPFPLDFKVYVFNVTNAMEVQKGDLPVVDEIGPYYYEEWKEKMDPVDNDSDDTLEFNPKDTFIFKQEKSGKLTGDEIVTIPHPMIVGMINTVAREKPAMLGLISKAIDAIYRHPESIFLTATVREIFFDGVVINCTVNDFAAAAVCSQLRAQAKELVPINDNDLKFSLIGAKNATWGGRFKVKRGILNSHDLGRVVMYENETEMNVWTTKKCNQFSGTDGTIFPPMLTKEEGLASFAPDLCRSLTAIYEGESNYKGVPVNKYTASLGDMSTNAEEKCFCPTPDTCLKKGMMDLAKCGGKPIVVSLPHFYASDTSYLEKIRGLHPSEENHGIVIYFESITGSPVSARKRLQFNMPLHPYEKVPLVKNIPEVYLPMFWIEEGVDLNATYVKQLNDLFKIKKIVNVAKWAILTGSIMGLGVAGYLYFRKTAEVAITPVHKVHPADPVKPNVISLIQQESLKNSLQNGNNNNDRLGNTKYRGFLQQNSAEKF